MKQNIQSRMPEFLKNFGALSALFIAGTMQAQTSCEIIPHFGWQVISQSSFPLESKRVQFDGTCTASGVSDVNVNYYWTFTPSTEPKELGQSRVYQDYNTIDGEGQVMVTLTVQSREIPTCHGTYCQVIDLGSGTSSDCPGGIGAMAMKNADASYQPEPVVIKSWPNPLSGTLTIEAEVSQEGPLTIDILDLSGRVVHRIINGNVLAGRQYFKWVPAMENPAGIYVVRCSDNAKLSHQKIQLVK